MKKRDYGDFVQEILDSINDVENFIDGMEFEDFIKIKRLFIAWFAPSK
jgi:uncharacterized protein with HEPN domain